ncbi:MAG TPA: hypothetical protein P5274_02235, partial [Candidatus Paceibacterota bacterium]|nr:hypothetical protein [Candidatus Paceibacterota bacterium]
MAKQNNKKKNKRGETAGGELREKINYLKSETKRAIIAVFALAAGIFFVLARLDIGGRAGQISYQILDKFFGWGFYLVPLLLLGLAIILLRSIKVGIVTTKAISGVLFLLATLGSLSIISQPESGGLIGSTISTPLLNFFDYYASLVFLGAIILVSLLVALDTPQILGLTLWKKLFSRKTNDKEERREKDIVVNGETEDSNKAITKPVEPETLKTETDKNKEEKTNTDLKVKGAEAGLFGALSFLGRRANANDFTPPPLSL